VKILACDTSCDETSVAVIEDGKVMSNKLSSQIQSHQEWGGVVPSLAKRKHEELLPFVIDEALKGAKVSLEDIDVFAVTRGPGLAIALEVGIRKFIELSNWYKKPLVAVNHMEGHVYSTLAKNSKGKPEIEFTFPLLTLLVSGGHTEFVLMRDHGKYEVIGQTLDDAIGEAYDKVGRMLDLGYPAGPVIERIAKEGNENAYELPIPMKYSKDGNMSYSGLKTAAMKLVNDELKNPLNKYGEKFKSQIESSKSFQRSKLVNSHPEINNHQPEVNPKQITCDIAASFQKAAVEQILIKTEFVLNDLINNQELKIEDLNIGGGVAQNLYLRKKFRAKFSEKVRLHFPTNKRLHTDNAGMIGVAAYYNALRENFVKDLDSLDRDPNWRIDAV
jgi:N6-L-threonylcarbamoyladenine synthase